MSEKGRKKNTNRVFFTADPKSARIYAGRAVNSLGGRPKVLIIAPVGDVVCLNSTPGTTVFHAPEARVIGIME